MVRIDMSMSGLERATKERFVMDKNGLERDTKIGNTIYLRIRAAEHQDLGVRFCYESGPERANLRPGDTICYG